MVEKLRLGNEECGRGKKMLFRDVKELEYIRVRLMGKSKF